jgi:hypothetical protein
VTTNKKEKNLDGQTDVGKMSTVHHLILNAFPNVFRGTSFHGKTGLRDCLYEEMGFSFLEAEVLVDSLKKPGNIGSRKCRQGMRYGIG